MTTDFLLNDASGISRPVLDQTAMAEIVAEQKAKLGRDIRIGVLMEENPNYPVSALTRWPLYRKSDVGTVEPVSAVEDIEIIEDESDIDGN